MGKSTIQQNSYFSASMCSGQSAPSSLMSAPAVFCAAAFLPAENTTSVSGARFSAETNRSLRSVRNLAMPPVSSPLSSTRTQ